MKETPIFEEVFSRFFRQPGIVVKLLIGGLLSFVPVVNLLAFGYLYRFAQSVRRTGSLALPDWDDWKGLFLDGVRFLVPWLAFWLLPVGLAFGLSAIFDSLNLGAFAYLSLMIVLLLAPVLFVSALYRFQMRQDFKDLLNLSLIFRMSYAFLPELIIPALVTFAIGTLFLPLYGFAIFIGFTLLIAYATLMFRFAERSKSTST